MCDEVPPQKWKLQQASSTGKINGGTPPTLSKKMQIIQTVGRKVVLYIDDRCVGTSAYMLCECLESPFHV